MMSTIEMAIGENIKKFREAKKYTQPTLAQLLGVSKGAISQYENNQATPSMDKLGNLAKIFGVSLSDIIDNDEATPLSLVDETDVTRTSIGSEFRDLDNGMVLMTITLVDEYAYASYPHGWKDPEYIEELPKHSIVLPKRDKARYRAFVVRGDSMDDGGRKAIYSGDIAVGREVERDQWQNKLYMNGAGKDYIIVHQDGVFIKRIVRHDVGEGIIKCVSTNPDKEHFPDFDVRLSEVFELYLIWKVERDWRH